MPVSNKKLFLVLVPALIALDQLTKIVVRMKLPEGDRIPVIPRFFDFVHAENTGAAFSILQHNPYRLAIFSVVTLAAFVVIGVVYRSLEDDQRLTAIALCSIFAGASHPPLALPCTLPAPFTTLTCVDQLVPRLTTSSRATLLH